MNAIQQPNLPQNAVALVAVSGCDAQILQSLRQQGIELLVIGPAKTLPPPVASHADLQLLHLGGNKLLLAQESGCLSETLINYDFDLSVLTNQLEATYPKDISLNFLLLKSHCFGLCSYMPLQLVEHCEHAGLQCVSVCQGYTRCSVAVVAEKAAITADSNLAQCLADCGVDVLLIPSGEIQLPGYGTGFIGGCCGLIAKDKLAVTGQLEQHSWGGLVLDFLDKHQVTPVYLRQQPLLDIGGILPLCEM